MFLKFFICEKLFQLVQLLKVPSFRPTLLDWKLSGKLFDFHAGPFSFFDDYAKIIIVSDGGISLKQINMRNKIKTN